MSDDLINIKVNQKEIQVDKNLTVMQACEIAGEEIPRFCYHDKLSIAVSYTHLTLPTIQPV